MVRSVLEETAWTVAEAAAFLRTTPRTVRRWMSTGCRMADGRVTRLEGVQVGTLWRTSREACLRFSQNSTAESTAPAGEPRQKPASRKSLNRWKIRSV